MAINQEKSSHDSAVFVLKAGTREMSQWLKALAAWAEGQVLFPASMWYLMAVYGPSSRAPRILFWFYRHQVHRQCTYIHANETVIHTHTKDKSFNERRPFLLEMVHKKKIGLLTLNILRYSGSVCASWKPKTSLNPLNFVLWWIR